jgi:hypothetical protein
MSTSRESDPLLPTTSATTTTSGYYFLNKSDPSYTGGSTRAVKDVDDAGQVVDVPPPNSDPQEFAPRPVGKHKVRGMNLCMVRIVVVREPWDTEAEETLVDVRDLRVLSTDRR